jgi:hypothetical protein
MVESSFAPAPGAQANDALRRLLRRRLAPSDGAPVRGPNLGFSQYVSSRTILAGGCPAVNSGGVAATRGRRSSARNPHRSGSGLAESAP